MELKTFDEAESVPQGPLPTFPKFSFFLCLPLVFLNFVLHDSLPNMPLGFQTASFPNFPSFFSFSLPVHACIPFLLTQILDL
jgi:hypothetical protein